MSNSNITPKSTMYSFQNLTKNVIDLFKKSKFLNAPPKSTLAETKHNAKNIFVTVLITESTAKILNFETIYLEDIRANYTKSVIELPPKYVTNLIKYCCITKSVLAALEDTDNDHFNVAYTRLVEMEPSSSSCNNYDDLSELSQNEPDSHLGIVLRPEHICSESIMIINSIAHDDKLECDSKKIRIKTMNDNCVHSGWINVCRICHGGESTEKLVEPCCCKGSVALAHMSCLERWLKESSNSNCELCKHHFTIIRKPRFSLVHSILVWLCSPTEHGPELLEDVIAFCLYTPSAIISTYILMLLCDQAVKLQIEMKSQAAHAIAFLAIAGMAAIDFTYSSWLMMTVQKHVLSWKAWYRDTSTITVVLPPRKKTSLISSECSNKVEQTGTTAQTSEN